MAAFSQNYPFFSPTSGHKVEAKMLNCFGNAERFIKILPQKLWLEVCQFFLTDPGALQSEKHTSCSACVQIFNYEH